MRTANEWTVAGLIAVLAILFAAMVWPFLLSLLMGMILAALVRPLHKYLVDKRFGSKISAGLMLVLLIVVIAGPLSLFIGVAFGQAKSFFDYLASQQGGLSSAALLDLVLNHLPLRDYFGNPDVLRTDVAQIMQGVGRDFGQAALIHAANIPEMLVHLLLALATCFFALVDGREFLEWTLGKAPLSPDARRALVRSFQNSAVSVIWATVAVAVVESLIIAVAFLVLGLPGVSLATGSTFILSWIPFVHSAPVSAVALIYLYAHGETGKFITMALFAALAGVADNITRAVVLRGRQDMHPLLGLIAILGGIRFFGLLGVFVGPIVAAVLVSLLKVLP